MIKRWVIALATGLVLVAALASSPPASGATKAVRSVTIWVQTMDSCRHALPGAHQTVHRPGGLTFVVGPSRGIKRASVGTSPCPAPRGNCVVTGVGCISFRVPVPAKVPARYTITQSAAQAAPHTVPCNGGSACHGESALFIVSPTGAVRARTTNIYPDRTRSWYPSNTTLFAGTRADPILFHDFVLGNVSCDGDHDADDHLTGSPSSHCDSENDRAPKPGPGPKALHAA